MTVPSKLISICIPAYNRARHLRSLLDSVFEQDFKDFEIVICEDCSPEREAIGKIVAEYQRLYPGFLRYFENEKNLGYDGNLRELVSKACGRFCFFMGNDDIMCPQALRHTADLIGRYDNLGVILKSYSWFRGTPDRVVQTVHYFAEEKYLSPGVEAISVCFRRSGVISGYIVDREEAQKAATTLFDGSLYYQMHLTAFALTNKAAVATPKVLVLCRDGEAPEFGNSESEAEKYTPGRYTPEARLSMMSGALSIVRALKERAGIDIVEPVMRDYANYFYLCIRDQLNLPLGKYFKMCRSFSRLGFYRYPSFYFYCVAGYLLGQDRCDALIKRARSVMRSSPRWGTAR
ncbi:glycosyltransferase family 2 protein [Acidobacteria bacterium AB60]|nr:glycosyltransferase family 2 protein [Acidobacteria bacterium AB60]